MQVCTVEKYKGYVGIQGAWLSELLGVATYKNSLNRGHIRSLRRGGNGRSALVDWVSMGTKLKSRVMEELGYDPASAVRESLLHSILRERESLLADKSSHEYYSKIQGKDGHFLKPEKVEELWNSARILEAVRELLDRKRRSAELGNVRLNVKREFESLADEIAGMKDYPHCLPSSADALRKKYNAFTLHGCETLVHGLTGKASNRQARPSGEKAVVEALVASGAKLNDAQVAKVANAMGIDIGRRRVQEIRKENETMLTASREGSRTWRNSVSMQVDRSRPDMPLKMWSLDGWTAELFYRETKLDRQGHIQTAYWKRLVLEVVTDVMNDYPIGYAIGETEDAMLITSALQNAVHHTREVLGGYYAPWQIQSDHYALKAMTPKYAALAKYVTPAAVGNAKSKPVERYFAYLENEYVWALTNNAGHNITARNRANDEYLNEHKYYFPDREGLEMQIYKIIEIERSRKIADFRRAWQNGEASMRRDLNLEDYLLEFGETGRGNMLTPNGLKLIRSGVEYKFDCFDVQMREHRAERWTLRYDLNDMNQALATSEDGTLRYMVSAKKRVPMALVDYREEDWRALQEYRDFNRMLDSSRDTHVRNVRQEAEEYVTRERLESPLSALLLTDSKGQHKTVKRAVQRELVAADTDYEEVEAAIPQPSDIWNRI